MDIGISFLHRAARWVLKQTQLYNHHVCQVDVYFSHLHLYACITLYLFKTKQASKYDNTCRIYIAGLYR